MPTYRVETDQGTFDVEADHEPTNDEVLAAIQANEPKKAPSPQKYTPSDPFGIASRVESRGERKGDLNLGLGADIALEAGLPAAAQILTAPFTPAAQAAAGGVASFVGNALAQLRRMTTGEQEKFSWGESAQATGTGSIPLGGPAAALERVTLKRALTSAAKEAAKFAAAGAGGEALKVAIDEGRMADLNEMVGSAVIPGAIGGAASTIGSFAHNRILRGNRLRQSIQELGPIADSASPGMLLPEELAAFEKRTARLNPTGEPARRIDEALMALKKGINSEIQNVPEGAEFFDRISPKIGAIDEAKQSLERLDQAAIKAQQESRSAREALDSARVSGSNIEESARADFVAAVEKASAHEMDANLNSALANAKEIAAARVAEGASAISPAEARDLMVHEVALPAKAAIDEYTKSLYAPFDDTIKGFDTAPILDEIKSAFAKISEGLPPSENQNLQKIIKQMESDPLYSLNGLRNLRSNLREGVKFSEIGTTKEDMLMKNASSSITRLINEQAPAVFGPDAARRLEAVNAFYTRRSDAMDSLGAKLLFADDPSDNVVKRFIAGMKESGINSKEYAGLRDVLAVLRESNPELADQLAQHANDTLKSSILYSASSIDPSNPSALKVDAKLLLGIMDDMGRTPGTLEQIGLGGQERLAEMKRIFDKYPEASALDKDQWETLLSSPSFRQASGGSISPDLEHVLAKTEVENKLMKAAFDRASGNVNAAERQFAEATAKATDAGASQREVQQALEGLLQDPQAVAFNNPSLSKTSFNAFKSALFDPASSKVTNDYISHVVKTLEGTPTKANQDLLSGLRESYIADRIAAYRSAPESSQMLEKADSEFVAKFFSPNNPGNANNELARAKALLTEDQITRLEQFGRAAREVEKYEKFGQSPILPGSYNVPTVGTPRRVLDAITDLYRGHQYNKVAAALVDPRRYSADLVRGGGYLSRIPDPFAKFGMGLGRVDSRRK